ncbi:PHD finger protein 12-like [Tropilaelaps mercedesae]|uniref:PHD finger protein 12-like n=1 Tax=Tropilaelaps mercedesae TaxID=418985 RepID=A0A1V9Y395_9ACAR|nr:PHD finger protein 12-like [Tropilaelaps mercedesae]
MAGRKANGAEEASSSRSPEPDVPVAVSKPSRRDERYEKSDFLVQWDPQEGLMPQILSLISSPRKESKKKKNNILIVGSSRECVSCGECGDVVCCSRCNSCFHTLCHNPPLDDDHLPVAKWTCFNCSSTTAAAAVAAASEYDDGVGDDEDSDSERPLLSRAFKMLLKAVENDNSEEFQLGKDVSLPYVFSGCGKPTKKRLREMKLARLDRGLVPAPVRTCFGCDRSSRSGPLIQCDYCPLMFHADCLDPPLTMMPLSRWMCPNHPHHAVDEKMTSDRHSERVRLWDEFCCQSVTERKIMLDFFHKNSRKNPPFNRKRRIEPDVIRVAVPAHVKAMYRAAKKRREQNDWLGGVISMNARVLDLDHVTVDDLSDTTVRLMAARMIEGMRQQKKSEPVIEKVQPRAFITPGLGSSGPQLCITENHVTIGKCNSADINLEYYGDCKYASTRHAVIFYDEVTEYFELVNYSEYGTHVDGVLYNHDVQHILKENQSVTDSIKALVKEKKKIKEKRLPMKRGRKSKAEKAALAAAAAAAQAIGSDIEEVDLTGWSDEKDAKEATTNLDRDVRRMESKSEITIKTETVDSEDTLSAAGASTPLVPKSEASEGPDLPNGDVNGENSLAGNGCAIKKEREEAGDDALLGHINGLPRACICEQTNLMGKILPAEGFEGSAILHNGSVLKVGCIVLLFNVVQ